MQVSMPTTYNNHTDDIWPQNSNESTWRQMRRSEAEPCCGRAALLDRRDLSFCLTRRYERFVERAQNCIDGRERRMDETDDLGDLTGVVEVMDLTHARIRKGYTIRLQQLRSVSRHFESHLVDYTWMKSDVALPLPLKI